MSYFFARAQNQTRAGARRDLSELQANSSENASKSTPHRGHEKSSWLGTHKGHWHAVERPDSLDNCLCLEVVCRNWHSAKEVQAFAHAWASRRLEAGG